MAASEKTLKEYLATYSASFSQDIDEVWLKNDLDKNGYLDKVEAKAFLDQVVKIIDKDRAGNYDPKQFDVIFEKFDENNDKFLSKSEMSVVIKKVFTKNKPDSGTKAAD